MSAHTAISWCDATFNPWWGCVKVSPACTHCYAETFSKRVGLKVWGPDSERRFFGPKHWQEPLKWNAAAKKAGVRKRVFCASMADVFEDRADLKAARAQLFTLIDDTPQLDWLLLTKRPENIAKLMPPWWGNKTWPNVWLGTTVENQSYADERIQLLLQTPAAVRFVSYEPALGPIDIQSWAFELDWLIAGGESGAGCRAANPDWFRSVRDQCALHGIAFHFKQHGGLRPKSNGRTLDGRTWDEFPRPR